MSVKLFDVSGKFVLPGTRKVETFSGRIIAETPQQGAKDLATMLNEKFKKDFPRYSQLPPGAIQGMTPAFLLRNLTWTPFVPVKSNPIDPIVQSLATEVEVST